jgi:hypothetical protein
MLEPAAAPRTPTFLKAAPRPRAADKPHNPHACRAQRRAVAMERLSRALADGPEPAALLPFLPEATTFLLGLAADHNFKVAMGGMRALGDLAEVVGRPVAGHFRCAGCEQRRRAEPGGRMGVWGGAARAGGRAWSAVQQAADMRAGNATHACSAIVPALAARLGDARPAVAASAMQCLRRLMAAAEPRAALELLGPYATGEASPPSESSGGAPPDVREAVLNAHVMVGAGTRDASHCASPCACGPHALARAAHGVRLEGCSAAFRVARR